MADKKKENEGKEEARVEEAALEGPTGEKVAGEQTAELLKTLEARNAELLDSLQRLKAEFDNYRKRMLKEQTRILETAESGLIKKLLPVIDNLERALENADDSSPTKALKQGVSMVREQFVDTLEKEGLEVIEGTGEPFDPEQEEAVMVVDAPGQPEGTVVDVTQKGYRFNGTLVRPAMVTVAGAGKEHT